MVGSPSVAALVRDPLRREDLVGDLEEGLLKIRRWSEHQGRWIWLKLEIAFRISPVFQPAGLIPN